VINPVQAGAPVLWSDVVVDPSSDAVRLRREMEASFALPRDRSEYDKVL
jgi:hypothetical protein